jgi:hypothetical protein
MKAINILIVAALPFLAGCSAIESVNEVNELHRSLPYGTPVQSGSISAKTPDTGLLLEKDANSLTLRSVYIGIVPPSYYSALHNTLREFMQVVDKDRGNALLFKTFDSIARGNPITIYFARYQKGDVVQFVYYTYLGDPMNGYSAEYDIYVQFSALGNNSWWDKVPVRFTAFLNSLEFNKTPNRLPEPTPGVVH